MEYIDPIILFFSTKCLEILFFALPPLQIQEKGL